MTAGVGSTRRRRCGTRTVGPAPWKRFTDDGAEVDGNTYWFRISETAQPNGNTGFVPKDAIGGVSRDGLPNCFPNGR